MTRMLARLVLAGILVSGFVWAQEGDDSNDAGEAGHGVARISLLNGDVSAQRGDSGDTVAAAVNGPLVAGDHLLTGPAARAEIQFDWANFVRLGTDTEVRLASLENNHFQVQLGKGTITLAVIRDSSGEVEIDTPNMAFQPRQRGVYRVSVTDDGQTEVTVRAGEGETYTPQGTEAVQAGQTMIVRGDVNDPEFQVVQAIPVDDWDRWNQQRDQGLLNTRSYQYVSPEIGGAGELDSYGRWVYEAPYGWVWSPNGVGPEWAPYRDGRWTWLDWYGWSWVSYDPWGWAPYHYGRWFRSPGFGWCWFPGPIYHHYYWRPALVSFFGFGRGGVGVGLGFGSIGWVPLGPHEAFHPWYGRGSYGFRGNANFANSVRETNVTNIRNTYINARVGNGISGVGAGVFSQGGRPGALRLTGQEQISAMRGPVPVAPTSASLRMSNRPARFTPAASGRTEFYSPRPASANQRVPFSAQRQGAARYAGQTPGAPMARTADNAAPATRGWRQVSPQPAGQNRQSSSPDWRSFGRAPQAGRTTPQYQTPRGYPGGTAPRYSPASSGVRINPPIVRERAQSSGSGSRSGAGGGRSSGGGGGGGRSSGGGGGHSSGGGGGGHSHSK
jgi:hypothetical protein